MVFDWTFSGARLPHFRKQLVHSISSNTIQPAATYSHPTFANLVTTVCTAILSNHFALLFKLLRRHSIAPLFWFVRRSPGGTAILASARALPLHSLQAGQPIQASNFALPHSLRPEPASCRRGGFSFPTPNAHSLARPPKVVGLVGLGYSLVSSQSVKKGSTAILASAKAYLCTRFKACGQSKHSSCADFFPDP